MIDIKDLVPVDEEKLYRYEKVNPGGAGTGQYEYLKYAPGELAQEPTAINRRLLMAMQGFIGKTTVFNPDGSITETNQDGDAKVTAFNPDGSITETFTSGTMSMTKTTTFNPDGSISEVIT
ncbi:MAG: hypothetical protein PHW03_07245 [Eubacteriales bacterium]|nr:hypothetical protein [Eubacteriales bacterium]